MRASAQTTANRNAYWYGKIVYYYLASFKWNLQQKKLFKALSRGTFALAGFLAAGGYLFARDFWHGVTQPHFNLVGVSLQSVNSQLYDTAKWKQ
jgi:hypothetical protein